MKMTIQDTNLDDDFTLAEESQDSGPGSTSLGDEKETIQHGTVNTDPLYYDNIEIAFGYLSLRNQINKCKTAQINKCETADSHITLYLHVTQLTCVLCRVYSAV